MIIELRDAQMPFERLPVGAVLSDPSGRRYMKVRIGSHSYWAPSAPTVKGSYTDEEIRGRAGADWVVWL